MTTEIPENFSIASDFLKLWKYLLTIQHDEALRCRGTDSLISRQIKLIHMLFKTHVVWKGGGTHLSFAI